MFHKTSMGMLPLNVGLEEEEGPKEELNVQLWAEETAQLAKHLL